MLQWGCANLLDCDFVLRGIEKCPTEAQRTGTMGFFPLHLLHDAIVILQWRSNINMRNAPHGPAPSITKHLLYGRCRGITIAAEPRSRRTGFPAVKLLRERYITATVWTPHKMVAQYVIPAQFSAAWTHATQPNSPIYLRTLCFDKANSLLLEAGAGTRYIGCTLLVILTTTSISYLLIPWMWNPK